MTTKFALLTFALAAAAHSQQAVSINLAAATGVTSIPGGSGTFSGHPADPCFSFGNVAFLGTGPLTDAGTQQGVYATLGGTLARIADLNTPIPSGTGNFSRFIPGAPCISGANVAFWGQGASPIQQGIYVSSSGVLTRIADLNTPIPGGTGNFTGHPPDPCISGANVVFLGQGSGQQGVYVSWGPSGPLTRIADLNTPIPGNTGNFTGFPVDPMISGGNVAFIGQGANSSGVYMALPTDPIGVVADTSTAAPGANGASFTSFTHVSISATGVAFTGLFAPAPGGSGVYVCHPADPCKVIADISTPVPAAAGFFTGFGNVAIDPDNVVFEGSSSGSPGKGIYGSINGSLIKVVDLNDIIGGKALSDVALGRGGYSGDQVAFTATFTDGSQAVAVATIGGGNRCPLSQGYWKNHSSLWPETSLVLGSESYNLPELLAILNTNGSDASMQLAQQLIAAKLNIFNGSNAALASAAIADGDGSLDGFTGKLPYGVKPNSTAGQRMVKDANALINYNGGLLTQGCVN